MIFLTSLFVAACTSSASTGGGPTLASHADFSSNAAWARVDAGSCPAGTSETATTCAVCDPYTRGDCEGRCDARQGDACTLLAFYMRATKDAATESAPLFERACDLGSGMGCEAFARVLMRGDGMAKDERRGVDILERMCTAGRGRSCTLAGEAYIAGRGRAIDTTVGLRRIEQGCQLGNFEGCHLMANPNVLADIDAAIREAHEAETATLSR